MRGKAPVQGGRERKYLCRNVSVRSVIVFVHWKVKYFGTEVLRDNKKITSLFSNKAYNILFYYIIFIPLYN